MLKRSMVDCFGTQRLATAGQHARAGAAITAVMRTGSRCAPRRATPSGSILIEGGSLRRAHSGVDPAAIKATGHCGEQLPALYHLM